jgi:tRNA 2-thiouridine synthesizing protein A
MIPPAPVHQSIDTRGELCPIPTVKTALALEDLLPGQTLEVWADDPVTLKELPDWCRNFGHQVTDTREEGQAFRLFIRRGP